MSNNEPKTALNTFLLTEELKEYINGIVQEKLKEANLIIKANPYEMEPRIAEMLNKLSINDLTFFSHFLDLPINTYYRSKDALIYEIIDLLQK